MDNKQINDSKKNILSLYIPKDLIRGKEYHYSVLLYPIWGVQEMKDKFANVELFKRQNLDSSYYSLTEDSSKADYVFLPYNYWFLMRNDPGLVLLYEKEAKILFIM